MKITSQVLAEKIAEFITGVDASTDACQEKAAEVLAAIPELKGFDRLAQEVRDTYLATKMALESAPSDVEDSMIEMRDDLASAYEKAVGESPDDDDE